MPVFEAGPVIMTLVPRKLHKKRFLLVKMCAQIQLSLNGFVSYF